MNNRFQKKKKKKKLSGKTVMNVFIVKDFVLVCSRYVRARSIGSMKFLNKIVSWPSSTK